LRNSDPEPEGGKKRRGNAEYNVDVVASRKGNKKDKSINDFDSFRPGKRSRAEGDFMRPRFLGGKRSRDNPF